MHIHILPTTTSLIILFCCTRLPSSTSATTNYNPNTAPCPNHPTLTGYTTLPSLQSDLTSYYRSFETLTPTSSPTTSFAPTTATKSPAFVPTSSPTPQPTDGPSVSPTDKPTDLPTKAPITLRPTPFPTSAIRTAVGPTASPAPSIELVIVGLDLDGNGGNGGGGTGTMPPDDAGSGAPDAVEGENFGDGIDRVVVVGPGGDPSDGGGEENSLDPFMDNRFLQGVRRLFGLPLTTSSSRGMAQSSSQKRRTQEEEGEGQAANAGDSQIITDAVGNAEEVAVVEGGDGEADKVGMTMSLTANSPEEGTGAGDGTTAQINVPQHHNGGQHADPGQLDQDQLPGEPLPGLPTDGAIGNGSTQQISAVEAPSDQSITPSETITFPICPNSNFDFKDANDLLQEYPPIKLQMPVSHSIDITCLSTDDNNDNDENNYNCIFTGGKTHILFHHHRPYGNFQDIPTNDIDISNSHNHLISIKGITFAKASLTSISMQDPRGKILFQNCTFQNNQGGQAVIMIDGKYDSEAVWNEKVKAEQDRIAAEEEAKNYDPNATTTSSTMDMSIFSSSTSSTVDNVNWEDIDEAMDDNNNGGDNNKQGNNDNGRRRGRILTAAMGFEEDGGRNDGGNGLDGSLNGLSASNTSEDEIDDKDYHDQSLFMTDTLSLLPPSWVAILDEVEEEEKVEEPTTSTNYVVNEEEWEIMGMDYEQEEEIVTMQRHLEEGNVVEDIPRSIVTIENCRFTGNKVNATIMVSSYSEELTIADQDPGVLGGPGPDLVGGEGSGGDGMRLRGLRSSQHQQQQQRHRDLNTFDMQEVQEAEAEAEANKVTPLAHSVHLALKDTTFESESVDTSIIENYGGRLQSSNVVFANNTAESIIRSESGTVAMTNNEFSHNQVKGEQGVVVLDSQSLLEENEATCVGGTSDDGTGKSPVVANRLRNSTEDGIVACEGIIVGEVCNSFVLCNDIQPVTTPTVGGSGNIDPELEACFSNWDDLVIAVRDKPGNQRDFIICSGAALIAVSPVIIDSDYITIQCGTELSPSKDCTISGGSSHFHITGSSSGVQLARLTLKESTGSSIKALGSAGATATLSLVDCTWMSNSGASAILIHKSENYTIATGLVISMLSDAVDRSAMSVEVRNCEFGDNELSYGAIANIGGALSVYKTKFANNSGRGGDIVVSNKGSFFVEESCFDGSSSVAPGVIFAEDGSEMTGNTNNFGFTSNTAGSYTGGDEAGTCTSIFQEGPGANCLGSTNCAGSCTSFTATTCMLDEPGAGNGAPTAAIPSPTPGQIFVPAYSRSEGSGSSNMVPIVVATLVCAFVVFGFIGIIARRRKASKKNGEAETEGDDDDGVKRSLCCCKRGRKDDAYDDDLEEADMDGDDDDINDV